VGLKFTKARGLIYWQTDWLLNPACTCTHWTMRINCYFSAACTYGGNQTEPIDLRLECLPQNSIFATALSVKCVQMYTIISPRASSFVWGCMLVAAHRVHPLSHWDTMAAFHESMIYVLFTITLSPIAQGDNHTADTVLPFTGTYAIQHIIHCQLATYSCTAQSNNHVQDIAGLLAVFETLGCYLWAHTEGKAKGGGCILNVSSVCSVIDRAWEKLWAESLRHMKKSYQKAVKNFKRQYNLMLVKSEDFSCKKLSQRLDKEVNKVSKTQYSPHQKLQT